MTTHDYDRPAWLALLLGLGLLAAVCWIDARIDAIKPCQCVIQEHCDFSDVVPGPGVGLVPPMGDARTTDPRCEEIAAAQWDGSYAIGRSAGATINTFIDQARDQMRQQDPPRATVLSAPLWIVQAEADRLGISVQAVCELWGLE